MDKQNWQQLRDSLLHLHKTLLDFERRRYEGQNGKVASPGALLGLVMQSPSFAWLRQLSELVVALDELLESKEEVPEQKFTDLSAYLKKLLTPNPQGSSFEKNYFEALQKSPDAALGHSKVLRTLTKISR